MKHIILIGILSLMFACSSNKTEQSLEKQLVPNELIVLETQLSNMNLRYGSLKTVTLSDEIKVSGVADVPPENTASVSVPIHGFIKTITHNVLPGKFIAKGGVLATIQSMDFVQMQQDYLQALNQSDFLGKELARQQVLSNEEATAKKKLQQIEADYTTNQTLIKGLAAKLKIVGVNAERLKTGDIQTNLQVLSPISGYIKTSSVSIGKNISPTDLLFEIVSKEHLHLELKVFEKDAYKIKEGQKVILDEPKLGESVSGKVFLIGKTFEGESKMVNIHVHLDDETIEAKILPGMYVMATIYAGTKQGTVLPESAVIKDNSEFYVYFLKDKKNNETIFGRVKVKVGERSQGQIEVIFPDKFDTNVSYVTEGSHTLQALYSKNQE